MVADNGFTGYNSTKLGVTVEPWAKMWTSFGPLADTGPDMLSRDLFLRYLREGLVHLYEPRHLRQSPLATLFGVANRFDTASALQRIIVDAVRSLEPPAGEPARSRAWEIYESLFYRYVEQLSQAEVAEQMRMSSRHLRRKERDALEVLADRLWSRFDLGAMPLGEPCEGSEPSRGSETEEEGGPTMDGGLSWLTNGSQASVADLHRILPGVLDLAGKLAQEHRVHLETAVAEILPDVPADPVALRQCLLSLLTVAIPRAAGGQVSFAARPLGWQVELRVQCSEYPSGPKPALADETASLNMAQQLAALIKGRLTLTVDARAFDAILTLSAVEQLPVLVIDDNQDALQLLQRYTLGTRYRFVGTRDPEQALALAAEFSPQAVVLDVMMPHLDGWELLGRLRQHPATANIPIIVCTILAQKEMARLLGANAFLKKPVTRQAFLAALDQTLELAETGSR